MTSHVCWAVWNSCNDTSTTNGTNVCTWHAWNTQAIAQTSATTGTTWQVWQNQASSAAAFMQNSLMQSWVVQQERTSETRAQKKRRRIDEWRAGWASAWQQIGTEIGKRAAKARARRLLVEALSAEQQASYEKNGYFIVEVGGTKYRIDQGTHGNVKQLDHAGRPIYSYCIQPANVPDEDAMLAQKLMLETDEEAFKRIANRSPWR